MRWIVVALVVVGVVGCAEPPVLRRAEPIGRHQAAEGPSAAGHAPPQAAPTAVAPAPAPPRGDMAVHVEALRERLPAGFSLVVEPPFVVVGDEPQAVVARRAESTVRWATRHLEAQFFDERPRHVLDVWLFKDARSYRDNALRLFGDEPDTPYGYYSPSNRALVMNISTGGGTLVHEIVHPYVEADYPNCPAWLNEGLGSLFEQSAERNGRIVGLTNWRLAGLQRALRSNDVPSFRVLTQMGDGFYDDHSGRNYAQARYLLYYLQERGLLEQFYRAARDARHEDPTAYEALRRVLGEPDMKRFQQRWREYVLALSFP